MRPEEYEASNHRVVVASNSISIALCSTLILFVIILFTFRRKLLSYTSYLISIIILLTSVFYSIFQIMAVVSSSVSVCNLSSWGVVFGTVFSMQLACVLAFHIQLTVIHKVYPPRWIMCIYVLISLNLSVVISLLPVIFSKIGYHQEEDWASCWYHNEFSSEGKSWSFATFYGWIIFAILYCASVLLVVVYQRYRYKISNFYRLENAVAITALKQSIRIIILYPVVPILCYTLSVYMLLFGPSSYYLRLISSCLQGLQGTFNTLVFITNPIFLKEIKSLLRTPDKDLMSRFNTACNTFNGLAYAPSHCYLPKNDPFPQT